MKHPVSAHGDKLLLDAKDIEILTGLGRTKTRALLRQQIIPNFRLGKCIRVSRIEFERWLQEQHDHARRQAQRFDEARTKLGSKGVRS